MKSRTPSSSLVTPTPTHFLRWSQILITNSQWSTAKRQFRRRGSYASQNIKVRGMYLAANARRSGYWIRAKKEWRLGAESNRCIRICNPLHHHSATEPKKTCASDCSGNKHSESFAARGEYTHNLQTLPMLHAFECVSNPYHQQCRHAFESAVKKRCRPTYVLCEAMIPAGLPFLFAQNLGKRLKVNHHRPQSQHNGEEQNSLCKPAPVFISVREND